MNNVITMLCVLHSVIAFSQSKPAPPYASTLLDIQCALREQIDQSLYVWDSDPINEMSLLHTMDSLIGLGAEVRESELQRLFVRDGGGWSSATSPRVLEWMLDRYGGEDKTGIVSQLLLDAIRISDPGVVELLIAEGARPSHPAIRQCLMGITPDYCPSYETLRLLVEKIGFDLYEQCNITLPWWLVYERATMPGRCNRKVLVEEREQYREEAGLTCNQSRDSGVHFLDPDLFPADKNAWELAELYGDVDVLAYRNQWEALEK